MLRTSCQLTGFESEKGSGCDSTGGGSADLKIFPHYEGLHRAHLQTLQGVPNAKDKFAGVLADLVKEPATTRANLKSSCGQPVLTTFSHLRTTAADRSICRERWHRAQGSADGWQASSWGTHFEMSRFSMTNLTFDSVSALSSMA